MKEKLEINLDEIPERSTIKFGDKDISSHVCGLTITVEPNELIKATIVFEGVSLKGEVDKKDIKFFELNGDEYILTKKDKEK